MTEEKRQATKEYQVLTLLNNQETSGYLNNILIDLNKTIKSLEIQVDCPSYVRYIIKGLYKDLITLQGNNNTMVNNIMKIVKGETK
jgi:hypothetical protein